MDVIIWNRHYIMYLNLMYISMSREIGEHHKSYSLITLIVSEVTSDVTINQASTAFINSELFERIVMYTNYVIWFCLTSIIKDHQTP